MFALGVVATFLWFMSGPAAHRKDIAANIGLTVLNIAWIPLLGSYLLVMLRRRRTATRSCVAVIGLTFVYDTAAFLSRVGLGRAVLPAPARAERQPEEVGRRRRSSAPWSRSSSSVTLVTSFVDPFEDTADRDAAARPGGRGRGDVRRPRRVADQARPGHQGHGQHAAGPRRGARPDRLAAVRGAGRVPAVPRSSSPERGHRSATSGSAVRAASGYA